MATIDPEILREQLENGEDVCVVDIRSKEDYADDHIEGSENRPVREALLSGDIEAAMAELGDLPDDKELVMVCNGGVTSTETARLLQNQGRNASALDGGLDAWKREQE